ncbi:NEDD8 ultimate buster 1-like [Biomphalaria glabrata]|uniref:NEDD8 ultimate buster 1-like n=1 Tax=Biomphalaria glabrata TaxID=6526 RepID=A0A9W2Z6R1_BIOGL|nr:NEDD8 ultimate buster 1-like [Biomphalaria glabrata]
MDSISTEFLMKRLRERLNAEKVKLWLPPFTTETKEKGVVPQELIKKYAEELKLTEDIIANGLEELRLHAIAKLEEKEKFQNQGVATLRIRLSGPSPSERMSRKPEPLECNLEITGQDLMALVGDKYGISPSTLKLITGGKIVSQVDSLSSQGIKNGSDVMALMISSSDIKVSEREAELAEVEKTRWAAEMLSSRADDDEDFDIQIADQNGHPLILPSSEKKALTFAMTLHEKGRAALKSKKVSIALPLFLEADAEFNKCRATILNSVDNYAILCLDIVWCYLLLKNLEQLPDAEARLTTSETCFKRCYGEKMERLAAIKGGTGMEQVLFMRLYLLQGIVAFHQGAIANAHNFLRRAEFVLTLLHVDDNKLQEIMLMGFTEREARLGLRAKNGNVQQAVAYIVEKKKEEEEVNKKAKKEWRQRVRGKKLGKTAGGEPVNVEYYDTLLDMDFPSGAAAEALRLANNDINQAIEILNARPELLHLPPIEKHKVEITDAMIEQVCSLGFTAQMARKCLQQFKGDLQRAVDELLKHNGVFPMSSGSFSPMSDSSHSSVSSAYSSSDSEMSASDDLSAGRLNPKEKEELQSLVSDISTDTNDHLDLTLSEEREILVTYMSLIENSPA